MRKALRVSVCFAVAPYVSVPFRTVLFPLLAERVIRLVLVQQSSSLLWTVPLILSHKNVEPSFQLKGPPSLSYLKCLVFVAAIEIGEKSYVKT